MKTNIIGISMRIFTVNKNITISRFIDCVIENRKIRLSPFVRKKVFDSVKDEFKEIRHSHSIARWLDKPLDAIKEIKKEKGEDKLDEFLLDASSYLSESTLELEFKNIRVSKKESIFVSLDTKGIHFKTDIQINESDELARIKYKFSKIIWFRVFLEEIQKNYCTSIMKGIHISDVSIFYEKVLYVEALMEGDL